MKCDQCQCEMAPDEVHEHGGRKLCDDCYMDAMSPKTGCDPGRCTPPPGSRIRIWS